MNLKQKEDPTAVLPALDTSQMSAPAAFSNTGKRELIARISELCEWQVALVARVFGAAGGFPAIILDFQIGIVCESSAAHATTRCGIAIVLACSKTIGTVPAKGSCRSSSDEDEERNKGKELHFG